MISLQPIRALLFCLMLGTAVATAAPDQPELVRMVQQELAAQGHYKGRVDGVPGSQTAAALRRFQIAHELKVTGKINRQTLNALGLDVHAGTAPPPPTDEQLALARLFSGGPFSDRTVKYQRAYLARVQEYFHTNAWFPDAADGQASEHFHHALVNWQSSHGLRPVGRFDRATVDQLTAAGIAPPKGR